MNDEGILLATSTRRDWLLDSALGPVIPGFIKALRRREYMGLTIVVYLRAIAHVGLWMRTESLSLQDLDEGLMRRFLDRHLPVCSCPDPQRRNPGELKTAWKHLLKFLREESWIPSQTAGTETPASAELVRFQDYLEGACGLAGTTCEVRVNHVQKFLVRFFGANKVDLSKLEPDSIEAFVLSFAGRWRPASLQVLRGSLNSYLRFRALSGDDVEALQAALPTPAPWNTPRLHKELSETQLAAFLNAFDRSTPFGQRDYAVARCLVDLGLRGHEVAGLSLDDLDWRAGTITIRGSKPKRVQILPLPIPTGQALADYLCSGRPKTSLRTVFVRHRAPAETPLSTAAIRSIANRAFKRCGLYGPFHNTHILRYSFASRLQAAGRSVKEIADVLRHQDLDTAARYIRIDAERLRAVARPWPGRTL